MKPNSAFLWANSSGTVGECQNTKGQLQVTAAQSEDITGDLVGGPYVRSNSTVLYASFKLKALSLPKNTPDYFAHFVGSANRGRVYAGTTNATPKFLPTFRRQWHQHKSSGHACFGFDYQHHLIRSSALNRRGKSENE